MIQNKLVESWLDNQGERRYQPALIQLLISEGWKVLHNTRHSPLEFGKDVIARSPDGRLCALQLKGNPGSRLTKREAQSILDQFIEAMESEIPESYGRKPEERHTTILVTNGEIDEEARELFDRVAVRTKSPNCPSDAVNYWARGELLSRFSEKANIIWPATMDGLTESIKIFGDDGQSNLVPSRLSSTLEAAFGRYKSSLKGPEKSSTISSIFLMTEILKSRWYSSDNHSALFEMSVVSAVFALQFADSGTRLNMVKDYARIAIEHANNLLKECKEQNYDPDFNHWVTNPVNEVDVFTERARLIAEAACCLVLSNNYESCDRDFLEKLISKSFLPGSMWGQFVIPSMIVRCWAWSRLSATWTPDIVLGQILSEHISASKAHRVPDRITNASPYYRFEDVIYSKTNGQIGTESEITKDETRFHLSFGRVMMSMLALRNWKQTCKNLWRDYSRIIHDSTEVPFERFFSPSLSDEGKNEGYQFYSSDWSKLINKSIDAAECEKHARFSDMHWLGAAYICIAPHRAEFNFVLSLDQSLNKTWFSKSYRYNS